MGHMVTIFLTFWETAKPFSKVAEPFYIPTSSVWALQFLHILATTITAVFFLTAITVGVKWYPIMMLICIFLMAHDVEQLFKCLLTISLHLFESKLSKRLCLWIFLPH